MSTPISYCLISKAAHGDEEAWTTLVEAMKVNVRCGHWTQSPCPHTPPCSRSTDKQMDDMNVRLKAALHGIKREYGNAGPQGPQGAVEKE